MTSLWFVVCLQEELHQAQGGTEDEAEGSDVDPTNDEEVKIDEDDGAQMVIQREALMVGQGSDAIWLPGSHQALGMLCCHCQAAQHAVLPPTSLTCNLQDGQDLPPRSVCCAQWPASCALMCSC